MEESTSKDCFSVRGESDFQNRLNDVFSNLGSISTPNPIATVEGNSTKPGTGTNNNSPSPERDTDGFRIPKLSIPKKRSHPLHRRSDPGFGRGFQNKRGKYVKYSLSNIDSSGKYRGLHGDKLNSAVALDFLAELKARKSNIEKSEEIDNGATPKFIPIPNRQTASNHNEAATASIRDGKLVMPEYNFGAQKPSSKRKATAPQTKNELASIDRESSAVSGMQIRLAHLEDPDSDSEDV